MASHTDVPCKYTDRWEQAIWATMLLVYGRIRLSGARKREAEKPIRGQGLLYAWNRVLSYEQYTGVNGRIGAVCSEQHKQVSTYISAVFRP
jgi:hypothetical protein